MTREEYLRPVNMDQVMLQIETTNICNHACCFCPNPKISSERGFIDRRLAMRLIREAYDMGVRSCAFFMFGEPLLVPDILDYYRYAAELGYLRRILVTNLAAADEEMIRGIFDSGVNNLKISVNGGKDSYARVHGSDDYERVMALLEYAYRYKTENSIPCTILSSFVVTKDNISEYHEHAARIRPVTDFFVTTGIIDFAGSVRSEKEELKAFFSEDEALSMLDLSPGVPCSQLASGIYVTADGYLTLCCHEPYGRAKVCDLRTTELSEAWYSPGMQSIREKHLRGELDGLICNDCAAGREHA